MNLKSTFLLRILFGLLEVDIAKGLNCYVCGDEGQLPCKSFSTLKDKYIKTCEHNEKACLLKIQGNKKMRSCQETQINDCKVANSVEYCFCTTDLCNDSSTKFRTPTDDEDLIEGSGFGVKTAIEETTQPVPSVNTSQGYQINNYIYCSVMTGIILIAI